MIEHEQNAISSHTLSTLTAEIVGAYVGYHTVATTDLPSLIAMVGRELAELGQLPAEPQAERPTPAVPIKRSVKNHEVVCLICAKPQKMLKRHLTTKHEITPDDYRTMFGLKSDHPLVAPAYAAQRSELAKRTGLGRKPMLPKQVMAPPKKAVERSTAKEGERSRQEREGSD